MKQLSKAEPIAAETLVPMPMCRREKNISLNLELLYASKVSIQGEYPGRTMLLNWSLNVISSKFRSKQQFYLWIFNHIISCLLMLQTDCFARIHMSSEPTWAAENLLNVFIHLIAQDIVQHRTLFASIHPPTNQPRLLVSSLHGEYKLCVL